MKKLNIILVYNKEEDKILMCKREKEPFKGKFNLVGGKVEQVLKFTGLFTEAGDYQITLKLIDRDSSDTSIVEKTFDIKVVEESTVEDENNNTNTGNNTENTTENITNSTEKQEKVEELPKELPKTGINYTGIVIALIVLAILIYFTKYRKKK